MSRKDVKEGRKEGRMSRKEGKMPWKEGRMSRKKGKMPRKEGKSRMPRKGRGKEERKEGLYAARTDDTCHMSASPHKILYYKYLSGTNVYPAPTHKHTPRFDVHDQHTPSLSCANPLSPVRVLCNVFQYAAAVRHHHPAIPSFPSIFHPPPFLSISIY
jgi:hypothetical protein